MTEAAAKLKLWFFRDLTDELRLKLFGLLGLPTDEIGKVHGRQDLALRAVLRELTRRTPSPQAATLLSFTEQAALQILVDLAWTAVAAIDFAEKGKKKGFWIDGKMIDEIEEVLLRLECLPEPPKSAGTVSTIEYALRRILPDDGAFIFDPELLSDDATPSPQADVVGTECQYAKDQGTPEHRCAVRCVYEEKGFLAAIEQAAQVAERYDETDTLSAPKAIASAIRALKDTEEQR